MASYTTNLDLKKPAQSDKIRIADINGNIDDIDAAFGAVGSTSVATQLGDIRGGIAIVSTGDVHAAISAGQFVYVMNHSTLSDGLYTANSALAANATLSSSNMTAVSGGVLNALNSKFATVEDKKITRIDSYFTERDAFKARRMGNTIVIFSYVNITTQVPSGTNFADTGFGSAEGMYIFMKADGTDATMVTCTVGKLRPSDAVLPTGYYYVSGCAVTPI